MLYISSCLARRVSISRSWWVSALSVLLLASSATAASATADTSEQWSKLELAGSEALDNNKYWIAEPDLQQAAVMAGAFGEGDLRLSKSLSQLGKLYRIRGRFEEAEPYYEEALHVEKLAYANEPGKAVPAIGALIRFYLNYGTASKAAPLTEELLSIVEGKLADARAQEKTKYRKGQPLEAWAGVAAPAATDELIDWAITCDAVANDHKTHENYDLAERLYKDSLDLKTTVYGKNHLTLANSYDSLGTLAQVRGENNDAALYFADALDITEQTLSPDNPQVYSRLDKLARCLIKCKREKEAEELYIRAKDSFWKNEPCTNGDQARNLYSLGSLYTDQKRYEEAAPLLRQALELAEDINGPASIGLVPYLQRYAYTLYYLGRKEEWDQLKARASTISGVI